MPASSSPRDLQQEAAFSALLAGAAVVEADSYGPKVLLRDDGSYLKVFRRKRLLTSAAWRPYAQRFVDNAAALAARAIPCPQVISLQRFSSLRRDVVHYRPLPGLTLRQILRGSPAALTGAALRAALGHFIARLHAHGIFFRSIHLGNVVLTPAAELGLIDFADLKLHRRALGAHARARNFAHLMRYEEDQRWLLEDGGEAFVQAYVSATEGRVDAARVHDWLQRQRDSGRA